MKCKSWHLQLFGCLTHRLLQHAICLSYDPSGLLKPLLLCAPLSVPFAGINLFGYFSTPSLSRPEDLTFKWQLFPDLFRNLCSCSVLSTGTKSEAPCPAERNIKLNSNRVLSCGNTKERVVKNQEKRLVLAQKSVRLCIVEKLVFIYNVLQKTNTYPLKVSLHFATS